MSHPTDTLSVELGERSYPIIIGESLLQQSGLFKSLLENRSVFIVTNETIAPLYLDQLKDLMQLHEVAVCILPDGEQHKNLQSMNEIYTGLLEAHCGRDVTILALGGGVVGDMAGFAAATFQRGVRFIQLPTTLLAQVDSSVGGKTGVNHALGKNMIGAFYQPQAVIIDTSTLKTLPEREFVAGLAEVIKYGLIEDIQFLHWLDEHMEDLRDRNADALRYAILKSCESKARVVSCDERESGLRAILNFGHTFAHAIETATEYKVWLHGEAVGFGMLMALKFCREIKLLTSEQVDFAISIIKRAGLPEAPPAQVRDANQLLALMAHDKKVTAGKLRLILLEDLGQAFITESFDQQRLQESIAAMLCSD